MANRNGNNSFSDDNLDLTRIYGLDDVRDNSNQNLEDLTGYNLNESELNMSMNDRNMSNNGNNMQSSYNENMPQNGMNLQNNMEARQQEQRESKMMPQPQRQEQTMPTVREFQNNNLRDMQTSGNIEAFLRTQVGKNVRMQFLIGTNTLIEKAGVLIAVGDNFVVLKEAGSGEILVCDFDGAKFIRFEDNSR